MKTAWQCFALGLFLALPLVTRADDSPNAIIAPHAKDLVAWQGDKVTAFKADDFLKARYTVLYFGAGWCPDCRAFCPSLVKAYDAQPKDANRFEVLLLTKDYKQKDMEKYMAEEKMKWPALAFDKVDSATDLAKFYSNKGIPCLTVIDQKGNVILQSTSDKDGKETLQKLQDMIAGKK
jgi:thiol-disulfide isomerase/thioredoxin